MELGFAAAVGVPIFAIRAPEDLTLRQYVKVVPAMATAIDLIKASSMPERRETLVINPHASLEEAHGILERIETAINGAGFSGDAERVVYSGLTDLQDKLRLPYSH
jgi:hypothetical protein